MQNNLSTSFYELSPQQVLDGVESAGFLPTGEYFQLNSYENRVYDIFLEPGSAPAEYNNRIITKFYRPLRWSMEALNEEHEFLFDLVNEGLPVISPIILPGEETVMTSDGIYMSLFKRGMGRLPQELNEDQFKKIGRYLARLHNVGSQKEAPHRPEFEMDFYGWESLDHSDPFVAPEIKDRYEAAAGEIISYLESELDPNSFIRIHGDCHKGNILIWDKQNEPDQYFFVDFDDFCNGPIEQDFWMLFSDSPQNSKQELDWLLDGYSSFRNIDNFNPHLLPALQGLRIIYYAGWIAKRFKDPTFPKIFPQFTEYLYWAEDVEALEKIAWQL